MLSFFLFRSLLYSLRKINKIVFYVCMLLLYFCCFFCFYFYLNWIISELFWIWQQQKKDGRTERCVSYFLLMWHNVCVYIMKFTLLFLSYVLVIWYKEYEQLFFLVCLYVRVPSSSLFFFLLVLLVSLPFKKHENENENASEGWIRRQFFFSFFVFLQSEKELFPMLVVCWFYELCWWTVRARTSSLCLSSLEQQDQIHIWFICLFVEHIAWLSEGCFLKLLKVFLFQHKHSSILNCSII